MNTYGVKKMENVIIGWGNPNVSDYDNILDSFSSTKINSIKTSSVPLAQYWKNYSHAIDILKTKINIDESNLSIFFEYPTKSYKRNKASMSDIMLILKTKKIAIEAKFTEYSKTRYESIDKWFSKNESENKMQVLNNWKDFISKYSSGLINERSKISYQFLHRTASACYENPKEAYVIYQLFWDISTKKRVNDFIDELKEYKEIIKPNENLKYLIHKVEVKHIGRSDKENIFQDIKFKTIYEFGMEEIDFI